MFRPEPAYRHGSVPKTGLLLVNLGTPAAPTAAAVRSYLRQFLGDPRVLDMNRVGRPLLLEGVILPFRPKKSAHAYRQIWDAERGSPLLFHGRDLVRGVSERLGASWVVELGMRYGQPSLASAVDRLIAAACRPWGWSWQRRQCLGLIDRSAPKPWQSWQAGVGDVGSAGACSAFCMLSWHFWHSSGGGRSKVIAALPAPAAALTSPVAWQLRQGRAPLTTWIWWPMLLRTCL